ncbi:MAG: prephenate dehydrogenase [bacterium]
MKDVLIVGLGIIGGSLALSLREKGYKVTGINRSKEPLEKAIQIGIIDDVASIDSFPDTEVTFVCTTVTTIPSFVKTILNRTQDTVVIDVGSTKRFIMRELRDLPKEKLSRFIGGHPMAGSEKIGIDAARKDLFINATFFLVPNGYTSDKTRHKAKEIVEALQANPVFIDAESHDKLVGIISHLPQLLSTTLSLTAKTLLGEDIKYSGKGYKDMTRLANSKFSVWRDILYTNRENIIKTIEAYKSNLSEIESSIVKWDEEKLSKLFELANN